MEKGRELPWCSKFIIHKPCYAHSLTHCTSDFWTGEGTVADQSILGRNEQESALLVSGRQPLRTHMCYGTSEA